MSTKDERPAEVQKLRNELEALCGSGNFILSEVLRTEEPTLWYASVRVGADWRPPVVFVADSTEAALTELRRQWRGGR